MPVGIEKIIPYDFKSQAESNTLVIPFNTSMRFTIKLYKATKNERATRKSIKWIWVEAEYLNKLRSMAKEEKFEAWGGWTSKETTPVDVYGIGMDYAKTEVISIANVTEDRRFLGKKYWLEAFVYYPEFKHSMGKYFTVKGSSQILGAWFEGKPNAVVGMYALHSLVSSYGTTATVVVNLHALPDTTLTYHNFVVIEVDIHCHETGKKVTDKPFRSVVNLSNDNTVLNTTAKVKVVLEDSWRQKTEHTKPQDVRHYYAEVRAIHYFNKNAKLNGEAKAVNGFESAIGATFLHQSPNGAMSLT